MDIFNRLNEVRLVADEAVPILTVPDRIAWRFTKSALVIANFAGREFFPGGDDLGNSPTVDWLEKGMNVIWHDDPSDEVVALRIKSEQGFLHHGGDGGLSENAGAVAGVDPSVDALAVFDVALFGGKRF